MVEKMNFITTTNPDNFRQFLQNKVIFFIFQNDKTEQNRQKPIKIKI